MSFNSIKSMNDFYTNFSRNSLSCSDSYKSNNIDHCEISISSQTSENMGYINSLNNKDNYKDFVILEDIKNKSTNATNNSILNLSFDSDTNIPDPDANMSNYRPIVITISYFLSSLALHTLNYQSQELNNNYYYFLNRFICLFILSKNLNILSGDLFISIFTIIKYKKNKIYILFFILSTISNIIIQLKNKNKITQDLNYYKLATHIILYYFLYLKIIQINNNIIKPICLSILYIITPFKGIFYVFLTIYTTETYADYYIYITIFPCLLLSIILSKLT